MTLNLVLHHFLLSVGTVLIISVFGYKQWRACYKQMQVCFSYLERTSSNISRLMQCLKSVCSTLAENRIVVIDFDQIWSNAWPDGYIVCPYKCQEKNRLLNGQLTLSTILMVGWPYGWPTILIVGPVDPDLGIVNERYPARVIHTHGHRPPSL